MKKKYVCGLLALSSAFLLSSCSMTFFEITDTTGEYEETKEEESTNPKETDSDIDQRYQIYLMAKETGFSGSYEEWLDSIKGDSIVLQIADGFIQWKYSKDSTWINLLSIQEIANHVNVSTTSDGTVIRSYTVNFDLDGGSGKVNSQTLNTGDIPIEPTTPTKDGYVFLGWYLNDTKWDFQTSYHPLDMTLTAKWASKTMNVWLDDIDANYNIENYLSLDFVGFTEDYAKYEVEYGSDLPTPSLSGATFVGWMDQEGNIHTKVDFTEETYLSAYFEPSTFTITYVDSNGAEITRKECKYHASIPLLEGDYVYSVQFNDYSYWLDDTSTYEFDQDITVWVYKYTYGKEYASEAKLTDAEKTAANTALAGNYDITVWVSDSKGIDALTKRQIAEFNKEFPDIKINATVNGISEADSAEQLIKDVDSGPDIYYFVQDQLARLIQAGAITELTTDATARVKANNDASAIAASTVAGKVYAYPLTSDIGYFMYYDKSVISENHIDSLEDIIADCEAAGRGFSMELETTPWYNAAFFFGAGCHSNWVTDTTGAYTSVDDDFNSEKGVIALKGMQKLLKSSSYISSSQTFDFTAATPSAVVVSGTWGAADAKKALGDNYGATDLPSFTVDGESYHLGSFSGNKLMGVKPQKNSNKEAVCQLLAEFLASATCQYDRYKLVNWCPSSKYVQQEEEIQNDPALSALVAQQAYAVPQGQIHVSWWDIAKTYAVAAKEAAFDDETALKNALAAYEEAIEAIFNMSDEQKEAWSVIGSIGGTDWDKDFMMTKQADDVTWVSNEIEITADSEFKVRQGFSWEVNYGITDGVTVSNGDIVKPGQAGTVVITFVYDTTNDIYSLTYEYV